MTTSLNDAETSHPVPAGGERKIELRAKDGRTLARIEIVDGALQLVADSVVELRTPDGRLLGKLMLPSGRLEIKTHGVLYHASLGQLLAGTPQPVSEAMRVIKI